MNIQCEGRICTTTTDWAPSDDQAYIWNVENRTFWIYTGAHNLTLNDKTSYTYFC